METRSCQRQDRLSPDPDFGASRCPTAPPCYSVPFDRKAREGIKRVLGETDGLHARTHLERRRVPGTQSCDALGFVRWGGRCALLDPLLATDCRLARSSCGHHLSVLDGWGAVRPAF